MDDADVEMNPVELGGEVEATSIDSEAVSRYPEKYDECT